MTKMNFGNFGDIEIYDQKQKEVLLNTKGIFIDSFYPNEYNREKAQHRARHLSYLFENYRYHKKLKYPKGRLRSIYIAMMSERSIIRDDIY